LQQVIAGDRFAGTFAVILFARVGNEGTRSVYWRGSVVALCPGYKFFRAFPLDPADSNHMQRHQPVFQPVLPEDAILRRKIDDAHTVKGHYRSKYVGKRC
jgi:hypothetical protein